MYSSSHHLAPKHALPLTGLREKPGPRHTLPPKQQRQNTIWFPPSSCPSTSSDYSGLGVSTTEEEMFQFPPSHLPMKYLDLHHRLTRRKVLQNPHHKQSCLCQRTFPVEELASTMPEEIPFTQVQEQPHRKHPITFCCLYHTIPYLPEMLECPHS